MSKWSPRQAKASTNRNIQEPAYPAGEVIIHCALKSIVLKLLVLKTIIMFAELRLFVSVRQRRLNSRFLEVPCMLDPWIMVLPVCIGIEDIILTVKK